MYKLTDTGVFKKDENLFIPNDPLNRHWQEYQKWLSEGNTPDPKDIPKESDIKAYQNSQRENLLKSTDWLVTRHRDQIDGALQTDLTKEDYEELVEWRQALRDLPNNAKSADYDWPEIPESIKDLISIEYPPKSYEEFISPIGEIND